MAVAIRKVTIEQIEDALALKLSTPIITAGGVNTTVFVEAPYPEIVATESFPSISINLISFLDNYELYESGSDTEYEYSSLTSPPTRTMIPPPQPKRIGYQIHCYTKDRAASDRELVQKIEARLPSRCGIDLPSPSIGQDAISIWAFRQHFAVSDDWVRGDYAPKVGTLIYHKVWTYELLFNEYDTTSTTTHKVVVDFHFDFLQTNGSRQRSILFHGDTEEAEIP